MTVCGVKNEKFKNSHSGFTIKSLNGYYKINKYIKQTHFALRTQHFALFVKSYKSPFLYIILDTMSVNTTPTGTIIPTVPLSRAGIAIKRMSIRMIGAIAIFQFFETNTTPSAPKMVHSLIPLLARHCSTCSRRLALCALAQSVKLPISMRLLLLCFPI